MSIATGQINEIEEIETKSLLRGGWFSRVLSIAAVGVAGVMLVIYLATAINWQGRPFIGALFVSPSLVVEDAQPFSSKTWAALDAGIQPGDTLIGMNGIEWAATQRNEAFQTALRDLSNGDQTQIRFLHDSTGNCASSEPGSPSCAVDITLNRMPIADFGLYFGGSFVVAVVIFLVGVLVLLRRSDMRSAKMFAVSAAALSLVAAGQFDLLTTFTYAPIWMIAGYVFAGVLLSFALTFPHDMDMIRRVPSLRYAPLLAALVLSVLTAWFYTEHRYELFFDMAALAQILSVGVVVAVMGWRRQYSSSPIIREQVTFVGLGTLIAFIPIFIRFIYLIAAGNEIWHEIIPVSQVTLLLYVLSAGYAILQYRLLETDRIIPEFMVYSVLTAMLLLGYLLLTMGLSQITLDVISADSPLLVALTMGIIVLMFNPARNALRQGIDRVMFRQRRDYMERSEKFSRVLTDAVNMTDILEALQNELHETVAPTHVFMFVYDSKSQSYGALPDPGESRPASDITFARDGGLVKYLAEEQSTLYLEAGQPLPLTVTRDRSRLAVLKTPLLMRLQGRDRLHGILGVGARRSGETYTYEDLRFIENLVDQASLAVERAQFVDDLEQKVRIQDVLSQVSRALNFAIDFDTLLELLYAQTNRIINADHFFIALYDHLTNELYYTFYSLGDERLSEIERKRWLMGKDVLSEVATRQLPKRLDHFTEEQLKRDPTYNIDLPIIHAWMGVPLVSDTTAPGGGLLGVMCLGSSESNVTYTDEQLDLLRDVANIAASAIDKTQLFQKTELRAAQLKALNDISSQLASELEDVDRLLESITENAVNILGCEAGSLLLVDDTTGDLVFRVVTGGGGQELIGTHISKDKPSLVADAVNRMEYVIVNDPRHDQRWHGEVGEKETNTKETGFQSRAILTIPLVAQGNSVGALQVINKRDGGSFTDEDAVLATTFAGQAAVAIENARLFETQDKQLLSRVQELEGMAAIDHSLNQTLILDQLVDIVMDWALKQTGAGHGALFLVEEDQLRLTASYGYEAVESIFATEGAILPFNTGILGRVVGSGKPSMVTDTSTDPHYVETLPGCKAQIALPLVSGAEVTGAVLIETDEDGVLDLLDMDFLSRFVERASSAISNALLYSRLAEQQKARAEFVSFIAHELKTPITSIKGYTSLLMRGVVGELNDQQRQFLHTIQSNSDHLEHLVSDIRDMEIIDAQGQLPLQMSAVDFHEVVEESMQTVQQAFSDKNQEIILNFPQDLPMIWADERRIKQVMFNFLTNANKYSEEGGHIEIFAEDVPNEWDTSGARRVLHIAVKDDGLGISQADLERLFEKYFRSTNQKALDQKGTGLGLTLTRRLIEQHGGVIWVESELNVGTMFHFTIPLASEVLPERATRTMEMN